MDLQNFESQVNLLLQSLCQQLNDQMDHIADIDYEDGVVTIELEDDTVFILNRHSPNQQIWLSSPLSGGSHYSYNETNNQWKSTRCEKNLKDVFIAEIKEKTNLNISLNFLI